jgi:hypothetical protein
MFRFRDYIGYHVTNSELVKILTRERLKNILHVAVNKESKSAPYMPCGW